MKKGFTLIELLIVIAVLGILAAGILATIDPFEQFKKARDTNARNAVVELYNGFIRFNANHGAWPWSYEKTTGYCETGFTTQTLTSTGGQACLSALIVDGELKQGFTTTVGSGVVTTARYTYLSSAGQENVAVCFQPQSKTILTDKNTKYDAYGTDDPSPGTCDVNRPCYWCAK